MKARVRVFALVLLAMAALVAPTTGRAALPRIGWINDSIGVPFIATTDTQTRPVPLYTTRRIAVDPNIPGRILLGNLFFGLYQSFPGVGWVSLTPNCAPRVMTGNTSIDPRLTDAYNLLDSVGTIGCSIEGIAFDKQDPLAVYANTNNFVLNLTNLNNPLIGYGGLFKAEIRTKTGPPLPTIDRKISTGGVIWRRLLPGVRGNALAVTRPAENAPPRLAVGRFQLSNIYIGTDSNPWCNTPVNTGCSPSVYISDNDGDSWQAYLFPDNGCGQYVSTTQHLVGNLGFDPVNKEVLYAGSNAGLYTGIRDNSGNWQFTNTLKVCGSTPGFVATSGIQGGGRRLYIGTANGLLYSAPTGATGPGTPAQLALNGDVIAGNRLPGQIISLILDANDPTERTLIAASWFTDPAPRPTSTGGVFKIVDNGNGTATVTDLKASFDNPLMGNSFYSSNVAPILSELALVYNPRWRSSFFLAQHPLEPDLLYASSGIGGVWLRSGLSDQNAL